MKNNWKILIISFIFLLIFLFCFFLFNSKSEKNIDLNEIKKSIVKIIPEEKLISYEKNPSWIFDENNDFWIWAWFFIDKNWTIITSNHIVKNKNINYYIITDDNNKFEAKIISRDFENDIAKLKINSNYNFKPLKISKNTKKINIWDKIISFWIDNKNLEKIQVFWKITNKNIKLDNISNLIEFSPVIKPGFSGWPIINLKWEVIWVNFSIKSWKSYGIIF